MKVLARFFRDDAGVTAIEYALIAGIIGTAIIIWASNIGDTVNTTFATIAENFI